MYAPYGEQLLNQLAGTYKERFTFTGKERDKETGYTHYDARKLSDIFGIWLSPDPLLDKYIYNSPYVYCEGNPIKFIDPNGKWVETAWDIANVVMDISSLKSNMARGNVMDAVLDGVGLVLDASAVVLPVPAGAGVALKAYRATDKAVDASKIANRFKEAIARGIQSEERVLKDMGLDKNMSKMPSRTNAGELINVIPDAVKEGVMYEVKDTKTVYYTKQIQGEYNAAINAEGIDKLVIITGENTHVSSNIPADVEIMRRSDLGPQ